MRCRSAVQGTVDEANAPKLHCSAVIEAANAGRDDEIDAN